MYYLGAYAVIKLKQIGNSDDDYNYPVIDGLNISDAMVDEECVIYAIGDTDAGILKNGKGFSFAINLAEYDFGGVVGNFVTAHKDDIKYLEAHKDVLSVDVAIGVLVSEEES